jgi:uncharacterized protein YsxB (DUF464 family)
MFTLSDDIKLWATMVGLIMAFAIYMDSITTPRTKKWLSEFLSAENSPLLKIVLECPRLFIESFDSLFGKNHLSMKCFIRSSLASIIVILIIGFVLRGHSSFNPFSLDIVSSGIAGIVYVMFLLILSILLNIIPDYLSLLETRYIIHKSLDRNIKYLLLIILLDFFISGIIYILIAGLVSYTVLSIIQANLLKYYLNIYSYLSHFASMCLGGGYTIFFLSTYFTSFWMYMLLIFGITIKIAHPLNKFCLNIFKHLVVEEKPFQSIGLLLIILFTITAILIEIVLLLLGSTNFNF